MLRIKGTACQYLRPLSSLEPEYGNALPGEQNGGPNGHQSLVRVGSIVRARGWRNPGQQRGAKLTFDPECRQSGGLRAFVGSGLNSRFVPKVRARSGARLRPGFDQ